MVPRPHEKGGERKWKRKSILTWVSGGVKIGWLKTINLLDMFTLYKKLVNVFLDRLVNL